MLEIFNDNHLKKNHAVWLYNVFNLLCSSNQNNLTSKGTVIHSVEVLQKPSQTQGACVHLHWTKTLLKVDWNEFAEIRGAHRANRRGPIVKLQSNV